MSKTKRTPGTYHIQSQTVEERQASFFGWPASSASFLPSITVRRLRVSRDAEVLSTPKCCPRRSVIDAEVLPTPKFYRRRNITDAEVSSTPKCCRHRSIIDVEMLPTPKCHRPQSFIDAEVLSTPKCYPRRSDIDAKVLSAPKSYRRRSAIFGVSFKRAGEARARWKATSACWSHPKETPCAYFSVSS